MSNSLIPLGIDISKAKFHVALLKSAKRSKYEHFTNDEDGFQQLGQWLEQQGVGPIHACLEATSIDGHALALYRHQQGHQVSISIRCGSKATAKVS